MTMREYGNPVRALDAALFGKRKRFPPRLQLRELQALLADVPAIRVQFFCEELCVWVT